VSPVTKEFILQLRINPLFREWLKELQQARPVVPKYVPGESTMETEALLERIKYESGRREGFDLMYLLLSGEQL